MMKRYQSYLLRLWRGDAPEVPGWLASLEDPHTRQVVSFNSLERLFEFIRAVRTYSGHPVLFLIGAGRLAAGSSRQERLFPIPGSENH